MLLGSGKPKYIGLQPTRPISDIICGFLVFILGLAMSGHFSLTGEEKIRAKTRIDNPLQKKLGGPPLTIYDFGANKGQNIPYFLQISR